MKLFLCWSGVRGAAFAGSTLRLVDAVLGGAVQPTVSMDIEKGAVWFERLASELDGAGAGVVCMTSDALRSPWIHYEAGILSRAVRETARGEGEGSSARPEAGDELLRGRRARLFTLLLGVEGGELSGPLSAYQSTRATDLDDVAHLFAAIVALLPEGEQSRCEGWRTRLVDQWAKYEPELRRIPPAAFSQTFPDFEKMFDRKTFNEPLEECLNQDWTSRYAGVRETLVRLRRYESEVRRACRPYESDILRALIQECSAYAMNLELLLGKTDFEIGPDGLVRVTPGVGIACEARRQRIKELVSWLAGARRAPVLDGAFRFLIAETFAERKTIIHRIEREIEPNAEAAASLSGSDWALDRIIAYLHRPKSPADSRRAVHFELEKAVSEMAPSLMPLHYSLRALKRIIGKRPTGVELDQSRRLVERAADVARKKGAPDAGSSEIMRLIAELTEFFADSPGVSPSPGE